MQITIIEKIILGFKSLINAIKRRIYNKRRVWTYLAKKHCTTGPGIIISGEIIGLRKNITIGEGTCLNGGEIHGSGDVRFGRYVHSGSGLLIVTSNHNWDSDEAIPYDSKRIVKPVVIGDFVWIGRNVTIMPGVIIEEGAILAAGSIVVKNVGRGEIVGGNPAKVIKMRDLNKFDSLKAQGKFK